MQCPQYNAILQFALHRVFTGLVKAIISELTSPMDFCTLFELVCYVHAPPPPSRKHQLVQTHLTVVFWFFLTAVAIACPALKLCSGRGGGALRRLKI